MDYKSIKNGEIYYKDKNSAHYHILDENGRKLHINRFVVERLVKNGKLKPCDG